MATTSETALAPAPHRLRVARTSRPRGSSTRTSSACRCSRPGARRTCCSAPSAPTAHLLLRPRRTAARWRSSSSPNAGDQEQFGPEDAVLTRSTTSRSTSTRKRRTASRSGSRTPATRSRSPSCSSTATAARCTSTDPERHDRRVHARSSRTCEQINRDSARQRACRAQALARRRSHIEQHVSLTLPMRTSTDRILTTHVGSLPRSQAVTDVLFARERNDVADAAAAARVDRRRRGRRASASRSRRASTS